MERPELNKMIPATKETKKRLTELSIALGEYQNHIVERLVKAEVERVLGQDGKATLAALEKERTK